LSTEEKIREICFCLLLTAEPDGFLALTQELEITLREHTAQSENRRLDMLLRRPTANSH